MPDRLDSTSVIKSSLKYASATGIIGVGTGSFFGSLMSSHVPNSIAIGAGIGGGSGCFIGFCCYLSTFFCCHTTHQEDVGLVRVGKVSVHEMKNQLDEKHTMTR